jgi:hypothetical protein
LKPGTWRALTPTEVRRLYEAASIDAPNPPANPPGDDETPG